MRAVFPKVQRVLKRFKNSNVFIIEHNNDHIMKTLSWSTCTGVTFFTIFIWDRCRQIWLRTRGGASGMLQADWSTRHIGYSTKNSCGHFFKEKMLVNCPATTTLSSCTFLQLSRTLGRVLFFQTDSCPIPGLYQICCPFFKLFVWAWDIVFILYLTS